MYQAILRTKIINDSQVITKDGFASVRFYNLGNDDVIINGNIPVPATKEFFIENHPDVILEEDFSVIFDGVGNNPRILVIQYYYKKV